MDGIQGAVLRVKLKYLARANACRRANARLYEQHFAGLSELMLPKEADYASHVYHVYAVRVKGRDALMRALADDQIGCAIHYPIPVHLQQAYRSLGLCRGTLPVAEKCADEFISLPMFAELTPDQIAMVAGKVKAWSQSSK